MATQLKVAITGGGIVGCTLARGLLAHSHIRFDIFESRQIVTERGAGVTFALNGENALREIGLPVEDMFKRAGGTIGDRPPCCLAAYGEHKGMQLFEQPPGWRHTLTRARWIEESLRDIPEDRVHANKTLVAITEPAQPHASYTLHFADDTEYQADAVIGCDGLLSQVRRAVFADEPSEVVTASFTGYWETRARATASQVADILGNDLFDFTEVRKVGVTGKGGFLMMSPTDDGKIYEVVMACRAGKKYDRSARSVPLSRETVEDSIQSWDGSFRDAVVACLLADEDGPRRLSSIWESGQTPTYYRDRLCIAGDAAHTMLPFLGQGFNIAMEDVAVLASLIVATEYVSELPAALKAYDKVRGERPAFMKKHSHEVAKLATGQFGLDPADSAHLETAKWWDYAFNIDMKEHIQEAMEIFNFSVGNVM